ncbi:ABC transporter ATP-binding protein, partial [Rhizobiaceae sp. 2RAB30]
VLGLVGESGSGKSTTGRLLVGLDELSAGAIRIDGADAVAQRRDDRKAFHRRVQMVFQDPYGSLNPQHTVAEIIARPLSYQGIRSRAEITRRVDAALDEVGLSPVANYRDKFPHQLSGGQRQRVCIARAIVLEPSFVVADEPISMLDVSIKWDVIRLLKRLVRERGISLLYITHDLATVGMVCDRIAIMYLGRIVEAGPVRQVLAAPRHPYTRALIDSVPSSDPDFRRPEPAILETPSADVPERPAGCGFSPRCPRADARCRSEVPPEAVSPGRSHACFHPLPEAALQAAG